MTQTEHHEMCVKALSDIYHGIRGRSAASIALEALAVEPPTMTAAIAIESPAPSPDALAAADALAQMIEDSAHDRDCRKSPEIGALCNCGMDDFKAGAATYRAARGKK